ncbi:NAD kinase 2, mitochondrial-like isoform X2 [Paramacrobiotus metropolitanus]|uniref:NAD kinase 2, mitochondrial-like isoform X2 n=1 Tax=Paramacrobiotus metropolitanus TaxID=2943436 RepID=UPI002445BDA6|nr:NAD kinase 2, mitochondrial-like isoform X2 [Paramacrobiotus metropolitanus]
MVLGSFRPCRNYAALFSMRKRIPSGCRWLKSATAAKIIASTMDQIHPTPAPVLLYDEDAVPVFQPEKVVVLSKITRYEFERKRYPHLSDRQLAEKLAQKGSDYYTLRELNAYHKNQADKIVRTLRNKGIETHIVNRYEYGPEVIDWADAIISAGGDGTFLLGASKIRNCQKPLIGINTDPRRSEGYLCLPKAASLNFSESLDKLMNGQFRWFYRQRIRIQLSGPSALETPVELHEQELNFPEHRFADWAVEDAVEFADASRECSRRDVSVAGSRSSNSRLLPEVALNEVFIGESLSSRVSYYEISLDDAPSVKQKSSGVTICTGTGSTSWSFNINKLTEQATASILKIVRESSDLPVPTESEFVKSVTKTFNDELIFDPSDTRLVCTIRDPVSNSIYGTSNPRGFVNKVVVKSRCFDASLVIDGGPSYKFNDGAEAILTTHPDDALRTVQLL